MQLSPPPLPSEPSVGFKGGACRLSNLSAPLSELERIVGPSHLVVGDADIARRTGDIIPHWKMPRAIVYPGNTEEIRQILGVAAKFGLPLWPCSKGKNWGYGAGTAPGEGAITLMLERMNRIHEVNEELAYAVIEPGVTYRQLNDYLKERRLKLWTDCTDGPPEGSVLGNALDRGIGETDYGDHFGNLCGIEALLADGTLVRTGGGAAGLSRSWNVFKWGTGPILEGLFSQANFGIVTRAGIWLKPQPEAFESFVFELGRAEDFCAAIDTLRQLALQDIIRSKIHMINDFTALAVVLRKFPGHLLNGGTHLGAELLAKLRRQYNVSSWSLGGGLYGTRAQVRAAKYELSRRLGRYGRLVFLDDRKAALLKRVGELLMEWRDRKGWALLSDWIARVCVRKPVELIEVLPQTHALLKGIPTNYFVRHAYFKARTPKPSGEVDPARDGCGLIWAGPVVPLRGKELHEVLELCRPLFRRHGFDFYAALMLANPRSVVALMSIFYDRQDPEETARATALYHELGDCTARAGYQQYRTSVMFMDKILRPSSSFRDLANTLKRSLDPLNILAPGKYGIDGSPAEPIRADRA